MLGLLGPNGAGKTTAIRISAVRASHGSAAPPYLARGLLPMGDGPVMGVCQDVGGGPCEDLHLNTSNSGVDCPIYQSDWLILGRLRKTLPHVVLRASKDASLARRRPKKARSPSAQRCPAVHVSAYARRRDCLGTCVGLLVLSRPRGFLKKSLDRIFERHPTGLLSRFQGVCPNHARLLEY